MNQEPRLGNSSMLNWFRYSGISLIISVNPLWWKAWPWARKEISEWMGPSERTYAFGWLGLTIRIWIDDGSW